MIVDSLFQNAINKSYFTILTAIQKKCYFATTCYFILFTGAIVAIVLFCCFELFVILCYFCYFAIVSFFILLTGAIFAILLFVLFVILCYLCYFAILCCL